jgi:hypothetical protein
VHAIPGWLPKGIHEGSRHFTEASTPAITEMLGWLATPRAIR